MHLLVLFDQTNSNFFKQMKCGFIDIFVDRPYNSSLADFSIKDQFCADRRGESNCNAHSRKTVSLSNLYQTALSSYFFTLHLNDETVLHGN